MSKAQKEIKLITVKDFSEFKLKEKGSVFIGQIYHAVSEDELKKILSDIKKLFHDATHICYAYKLFGNKIKFSDAGEPKGTAGIRILNAIEHFNLSNVLVLIIRYFGGVKLGVGPLGKAYYNCAFQVILNSKLVTKFVFREVRISFDSNWTKTIYSILSNSKIISSSFDLQNRINVNIKYDEIEKIIFTLKESTNNEVEIEVLENINFL